MVANAANALSAVRRNILPGAFVSAVPCAFVLEDNPKPNDNSLRFESFPGEINEAYAVNSYHEIAQRQKPQPGFAVYRGGNWATFAISLNFRAGIRPGSGSTAASVAGLDVATAGIADLEAQLIGMERKVRWCQALTFPMKRDATPFLKRIQAIPSLRDRKTNTSKNADDKPIRTDPPMVFVVIGSFMTLRCYVTNVNITWQGPWHPISARPFGAEVQVTFQRLDDGYPDWDSVRNQGGLTPQSPNIPSIQGFVLFNQQ